MRNIFKTLSIALAVAIVLGSCKKDENEAVSVNEVAGEYVAATLFYSLNDDGTISAGGTELSEYLDLEIDLVNVSVSGSTVTAKDSDGEVIFESVNLVEAANGVVWNLALPQDATLYDYTIAGFGKYEMEGKKYQAFYDANEKTIDFSLLFSGSSSLPDIVMEFVCQKR